MSRNEILSAVLLCACAFLLTPTLSDSGILAQDIKPDEPMTVLIRNVRVFDGEAFIEKTDVLLHDGLIQSTGPDMAVPESRQPFETIDGTGMTLMPGLIDCHVHAQFEPQLVQAALFGVTTEMDMMSIPLFAANYRKAQDEEKANHRADFFSAGAAVTVDGGHGTQFGFKVPMLATPEEAEQFINDRIREGSDYIKIIHETGAAFGLSRPTLSPEMLQAAIEACHKNEILAVAHIGDMDGATKAVDHGIGGLVHLFADQKISADLIQAMLEKDVFVVPTTVVIQNITGPVTVDKIIDDPDIGPFLTRMDLAGLGRTFPDREGATNNTESLYYNIAALETAGVPVLAGTDSPNPGTTHGASMHHELELLTLAGLTNQQALAAATSRAADSFNLTDRGRVKTGLRADLLLVNGNPMDDIKATRRIQRVWKAGHDIDRSKRRKQIREAREKRSKKSRDKE